MIPFSIPFFFAFLQMFYWSAMVYRYNSSPEQVRCTATHGALMWPNGALGIGGLTEAWTLSTTCMSGVQEVEEPSSATLDQAMALYGLHSFELLWEEALDTMVGFCLNSDSISCSTIGLHAQQLWAKVRLLLTVGQTRRAVNGLCFALLHIVRACFSTASAETRIRAHTHGNDAESALHCCWTAEVVSVV